MRKITTTFLVALLTFSVGFGTVAAKPKNDNPGKGKDNAAVVVHINQSGTSSEVGTWNCSGLYVQNKNNLRLSVDCTVENVQSYSGTYTSGTDPIPGWLMTDAGAAVTDAGAASLLDRLGNLQVEDVNWQVVVTPDGASEGGTVQVVAVASLK